MRSFQCASFASYYSLCRTYVNVYVYVSMSVWYLLRILINQIGFYCFFFFFFSSIVVAVVVIAKAVADLEDCIKFNIRLYYCCCMLAYVLCCDVCVTIIHSYALTWVLRSLSFTIMDKTFSTITNNRAAQWW